MSLWQRPCARWHRAGRSYLGPASLDHRGGVCWAIPGVRVSLAGHLAGGCSTLRSVRTTFCGSGAKGDFHPEGAGAPAVPPAQQSLPCEWEIGEASVPPPSAALVPAPPRAPRRGCWAFGAPGSWALGQEKGSRKGPACASPPAGPPGPPRRREAASGPDGPCCRFGVHPPRLPASFVRRGLHKMSAAALRHFVSAAGRRGGGPEREAAGRPLPPPALGAWTEPSAAPPSPGLGQAALDLAPADILAGRSGAPAPRSAPPGLARRTEMLQTGARRSCN